MLWCVRGIARKVLAFLWSLLFHLLCIGLFYLVYEAEGRKVTHSRSPFARGVQNAEKSLRDFGPNSMVAKRPHSGDLRWPV